MAVFFTTKWQCNDIDNHKSRLHVYWCNNLIWWLFELCRASSCLQLQTSKDKRFINSCILTRKRNINNNSIGISFSRFEKWLYCFYCWWSTFKLHLDTFLGNVLSVSLEHSSMSSILYGIIGALHLYHQINKQSAQVKQQINGMLIHFPIQFEWEILYATFIHSFTHSFQISNLICLFAFQCTLHSVTYFNLLHLQCSTDD